MKVLQRICTPYITIDTTLITVDSTLLTADTFFNDCAFKLFTTDTTKTTVDVTSITADMTSDVNIGYSIRFIPRFKISPNSKLDLLIVREIDNQPIPHRLNWTLDGNYIVLNIDSDRIRENYKYSLDVKVEDRVVYQGKAICTNQVPQEYKYTKIDNNKLYI